MPTDFACFICKKPTYDPHTHDLGNSVELCITQQDFEGPAGPEEEYSHLYFCSWKCLSEYVKPMLALEEEK